MSSHNSKPLSLVSQGTPDGSTVPTSGFDTLAASDGTAAQDHILLDEKIIEFGVNGEYTVDLDLRYIKEQGCQWTVAPQ
jgi:hypothetical protein